MSRKYEKKRLYGEGGEVNEQRMKDESSRRAKRMMRERFQAIREVTTIEDAGLHVGKRNRGLRRQPLRRHK
jgi:hypothetical protein